MLTYDIIYQHDPCWLRGEGGAERLRAACERLGGSFTIGDVLRADWIDPEDRVRVATRPDVLPDRTLRLFAARVARRALERERAVWLRPHPYLWAAVEAAERYACGEATDGELAAARTAAWAGEAAWAATWPAAWEAAWAAAWAATEAAEAAEAERRQQIADLLELMADEAND